jgi:hypothetical protein
MRSKVHSRHECAVVSVISQATAEFIGASGVVLYPATEHEHC